MLNKFQNSFPIKQFQFMISKNFSELVKIIFKFSQFKCSVRGRIYGDRAFAYWLHYYCNPLNCYYCRVLTSEAANKNQFFWVIQYRSKKLDFNLFFLSLCASLSLPYSLNWNIMLQKEYLHPKGISHHTHEFWWALWDKLN